MQHNYTCSTETPIKHAVNANYRNLFQINTELLHTQQIPRTQPKKFQKSPPYRGNNFFYLNALHTYKSHHRHARTPPPTIRTNDPRENPPTRGLHIHTIFEGSSAKHALVHAKAKTATPTSESRKRWPSRCTSACRAPARRSPKTAAATRILVMVMGDGDGDGVL